MPTKAELQGEIDDLRNLLRRTERALGQAQLDLSDIPSKPIDRVTPALTPKVREVLARGEAEWSRVVVDPCERVNATSRAERASGGAGKSLMSEMVSSLGVALSLHSALRR